MRRTEQARMRLVAFLVIAFALISASAAGFDIVTIDTAQLHSMMMDNAYRLEGGRAQPYTIIDTRTKDEYDKAHIFSAISIPEKDFEKSIGLLPEYKKALMVVYGNNTNLETCRKWADKAAAAGYTNIIIYSEGFSVWKAQHMPIAPL